MISRELRPVKKGQLITADWANALLAVVHRLEKLTVAPPLTLVSNEAGIHIGLSAQRFILVGKIDDDIPPQSSDEPGSGPMTVWTGDITGPWIATDEEITLLNFSTVAISADDPDLFYVAARLAHMWIPVVQFCGV